METTMKKYKTIYADPPWEVERGGPRIGANYHYPLMKTADICALPVREWSEDNAHLYLWTTNAAFPDALTVIESWGFKYITCITWVKNGIGIGQYFRGKSEHCLFARRGMLPYKVIDGKRQQGVTGTDADYCMMMLVEMSHPGLVVFPTHRLIRDVTGFDPARLLRESAPYFDIQEALPLDAQGLPVRWTENGDKGWRMELLYDEQGLPRRLNLTHANGQKAIVLVKQRDTVQQPFTEEQLGLALPEDTPLLPLSRYRAPADGKSAP